MKNDTVFELRDYTLRPGQREVLITLFESSFIESQNEIGAHVHATFRDVDRPDHFVWIRGFADMTARQSALQTFYGGPVWQAHRDAANAAMIDSDDVHLLRPIASALSEAARIDGALIIVDVLPPLAEADLIAALEARTDVLAAFCTEPAENNFPRLPVNAERVAVVIRGAPAFGQPDLIAGLPAPLRTLRLTPTARSALQFASPGQSPRDFDFLAGHWQVHNRKLKARNVGSQDWDEFAATNRFWTLLDGVANVDEFDCPARGFKGMSLRSLDQQTGIWSIHWMDSRGGVLLPPVRGGFVGDVGEFIGDDVDGRHPVLTRFRWQRDAVTPRWEQAFSYDGGATWETNWIMEFTRLQK